MLSWLLFTVEQSITFSIFFYMPSCIAVDWVLCMDSICGTIYALHYDFSFFYQGSLSSLQNLFSSMLFVV